MRLRPCLATLFLGLALCFLLLPGSAHAYLDPGTGSYVLQILLAAIVGALFAIRLFWTRIKSFFHKLFSRAEKDEPDAD